MNTSDKELLELAAKATVMTDFNGKWQAAIEDLHLLGNALYQLDQILECGGDDSVRAHLCDKLEVLLRRSIIDSPDTGWPSRIVNGEHVPCSYDGLLADEVLASKFAPNEGNAS